MTSARDEIFNGIIRFLTNILDHFDDTRGIIIGRKFEDAPRPTNSKTGSSCGVYASSVFGEVNIENMGVRERCKVNRINEDGCLLYTSPSPRDQRGSRMPSSA